MADPANKPPTDVEPERRRPGFTPDDDGYWEGVRELEEQRLQDARDAHEERWMDE